MPSPKDPRPGGQRTVTARDRRDWKLSLDLVLNLKVPKMDAEDVAQLVMFEMTRADARAESLDGPLRGGARFALRHVIAKRLVSQYRSAALRREAMQEQLANAWPSPPEEPTAEELLLARADHALFCAALDELREKALEAFVVFVLYELEGRPMAEVAAEQGIGANTAWTRLALARAEMPAAVRRLLARREGPRCAA